MSTARVRRFPMRVTTGFLIVASLSVAAYGSSLPRGQAGPAHEDIRLDEPPAPPEQAPACPLRDDIPPNDGDPMVRFAYVIPSDRTPQPRGVANFQRAIMMVHDWYGRQMQRWGYGYKSFRYETEPDGTTPKVHVIDVAEDSAYLRTMLYQTVRAAVQNAGVTSIYNDNETWVFLPETHLLLPHGQMTGNSWVGGGPALREWGALGNAFGYAFVGSEALPLWEPGVLCDNTPYHGLVIPELGPYPLEYGVTWVPFMGDTLSHIASCFTGGLAHEMGHGFGLAHDPRHDGSFFGNLMNNGFRGFRGSLYPDQYPEDFTRLAYASAMFLDTCPYFTIFENGLPHEHEVADQVLPTVTVSTQGDVDPIAGHLHIDFEAADDLGLVAARLRLNGRTIGEMPLSGTQAAGTFVTPYREQFGCDGGQPHPFQLTVYDANGNTDTYVTEIIPGRRRNYAPRPHVRPLCPSVVEVGDPVTLTAMATEDPNHSTSELLFEWDLDGDGVFDTAPQHSATLSASFDSAGVPVITIRVTDPAGAVTISTPINLLVIAPVVIGDLNCDGAVDVEDITPFVLALRGQAAYNSAYPQCNWLNADCNGDGGVDFDDIEPFAVMLEG